MNIAPTIKNSSLLGEAPAARQEIKLREKDEKIFRELQSSIEDFIRRFIFRCLNHIGGEQAKSLLDQYLLIKMIGIRWRAFEKNVF